MANPEHLKILEQGGAVWNAWREQYPRVRPDLSNINFKGNPTDITGAQFPEINFSNTNLEKSRLRYGYLIDANFCGADLQETDLNHADLRSADFSDAKMDSADLADTDCKGAVFRNASMRGVDLFFAVLTQADLTGADLTGASIGDTSFNTNDLRAVKGLDRIIHLAPSTLGTDTIYLSNGRIPEEFLRGVGVPDGMITFARSLATAEQPIQFYSCFISYSSKDQDFANRLYADLQSNGVRCWFAPEDLKIGDRFRDRIDESIRLHDKLLVVLSENSVSSLWVSEEVEAAFEREHREGRIVLFPIKIDNAVMESEQAWAAAIRRTRHIGDFARWKEHDSYKKAFGRLLRDLKAEETNKPNYLTPDSLENRAVLSPRNTLMDEWGKVEESIIQLAKHEGLVKKGELVDCGQIVRQLYETGKIVDAVKEEYFNLSRVHLGVAFNSSAPVEPQMAINFVNQAKELQKSLAVDTLPLR